MMIWTLLSVREASAETQGHAARSTDKDVTSETRRKRPRNSQVRSDQCPGHDGALQGTAFVRLSGCLLGKQISLRVCEASRSHLELEQFILNARHQVHTQGGSPSYAGDKTYGPHANLPK